MYDCQLEAPDGTDLGTAKLAVHAQDDGSMTLMVIDGETSQYVSIVTLKRAAARQVKDYIDRKVH